MKIYGTPVGVMFCEGAPFLLSSQASVLPFLPNLDSKRVIVEAYPKLVATKVVGTNSYKTDSRQKVNAAQKAIRTKIVAAIIEKSPSSKLRRLYGFRVECGDGTETIVHR